MGKIDTILKRRSIRKFKNIKVSDELIKELLEAAMAAPSAVNSQPWEFYVISNKNVQHKLKEVATYWNYNSDIIIVVAGNKERNCRDYYIQDCAAAIENLLLAASMNDLGTVWCGIYPVEERVQTVKEILSLDENIVPIGLLHVGYPDETKDSRTQYDENKIHYIK